MINIIEVVPYRAEWPALFEKEADLLKSTLGRNCIAIHHVGSTAILGMAAKPIIDIIPVVKNILAVDEKIETMTMLGYKAHGEAGMLFRRFFQKGNPITTHNIHVYEEGAGEIDRLIKFRDWMRTHPDDLKNYADLKRKLASQFSTDRLRYTMAKENFIADIDNKTGFDGIRIVKTLTDREWEAYHRIRKQQIFDLIKIEYDFNHPTLHDPNHTHLVMYKGSTIIGVAHLEFLTQQEVALRPFAIDTPYQNKGLGSILLQEIERWLIHQKYILVRLHANPAAFSFYERLGYTKMPFPENKELSGILKCIDMGKKL